MKLVLKGCALFAIACLIAPSLFAATHLDGLAIEVSNRLATASADDKPALQKAAKALTRNSPNTVAQLNALASAARSLVTFSNDTDLVTAQNDALSAYYNDALNDYNDAKDTIDGMTNVSKSLSNKLAAATAALVAFETDTNGVASAARLLKNAVIKVAALKKAVPANTSSGEAPESLIGKDLELTETKDHAPTKINVNCRYESGASTPFLLDYHVDAPEEEGRWTYEKTGAKTGVIHLQVDYAQAPHPKVNHDILITFTRPTGGTFTFTNIAGTAVSGRFIMVPSPNAPH
jgi:hypothetical protein